MKITHKIISLLLAVIMLCSAMTGLSVITASAATTSSGNTSDSGATAPGEEENTLNYLTEIFATPEDKLATMKQMYAKGNYAIYADERSGEVAVKDLVTDQVMFTNPYDIAAAPSSDAIKAELMSQIIVTYIDNGKENVFNSYIDAAQRGQITVKNIKGGIRVEYTIGREEARRLVPRWIEATRFQEMILKPVLEYYDNDETNWYYNKFKNWYSFKSAAEQTTDRLLADLLATYPCCENMDIYVFDPTANTVELEKEEEVIKAACPDYSYEEMDYDHQLTGYVSKDENPPVFKMALEYTVNEDGFSVRLPANGIRFNQSKYQLEDLSILPFMGAGNNAYTGYTFYPDGSGALFAFEDLVDEDTYTVGAEMYGPDYAYHTLSGGAYQQAVRYPVFGLVENTRYYDFSTENSAGEQVVTRLSGAIYDELMEARATGNDESPVYAKYNRLMTSNPEITETEASRGYIAILEEGDALAQLTYCHDGVLSPYDTVKMNFNPRPKDSYNLADSISVGTNSEWTVVSARKYVGSYRIRYIMLTDEAVAAQKQESQPDTWKWYAAKWMGMAEAYRSYLLDKGVLNTLSAEATAGDIPLYIEAFGAVDTIEKILSVPVNVKKALTTFEDVKTMYVQLLAKGVTDINFKLTGHANGGMDSTMPYNLKWEKVVKGDTDFQELLDFAAEIKAGNYENLLAYAKDVLDDESYAALENYLKDAKADDMVAAMGIFPEFEFSFTNGDKWFDGLSLRKHAVKTIDDRYTSKRMYSATQQKYIGYYQLAISPAYFNHFYEELVANYKGYENVTGISVGSLGNALNSDFDEDEPYNREDSKSFVSKALEYFGKQDLEVMVDGGNAYTWQFTDHILNAPLDSSRYILASYSVPFLGAVLHGYVNFAGSPLNMEGDVQYAKLKAIENGASIYFTLSYQNTQLLKEDPLLSQYYSIRYDIWFDDVVAIYNEINEDLKDVQDNIIIDHQFLSGMRVPDSDELEYDIISEYEDILAYEQEKAEFEEMIKNQEVADARDRIASTVKTAEKFITVCLTYYGGINGAANQYIKANDNFTDRMATYIEADAAYKDVAARYKEASSVENPTAEQKAEITRLQGLLATATTARQTALGSMRNAVRKVNAAIARIENAYNNLQKLYAIAEQDKLLIQNDVEKNSDPAIIASIMGETMKNLEEIKQFMNEQLGLTFDQTVEKLSLDTFLQAHISYLKLGAYGADSATAVGVAGKAENIYEMLASGNYGLGKHELVLLRAYEGNDGLTDEELLDKYGMTNLADGETSVDALVMHARELLGDQYAFDYLMDEDAINDNILQYFVNTLLKKINNAKASSMVPELDLVKYRRDVEGNLVDNPNVKTAQQEVDSILNAALIKGTDGKKAILELVKDGNYSLYDNMTEADMDALVERACKALETYCTSSDKYVEYANPQNMAADVRARAEGLYYKEAIAKKFPAGTAVTLKVVTVSYTTDDSLTLLFNQNQKDYIAFDSLVERYQALKNDTVALDALAELAQESALSVYGDVTANLYAGYIRLFARKAIQDKSDTSLYFSLADAIAEASETAKGEQSTVKNTIDAALSNVKEAMKTKDYAKVIKLVTELEGKNNYIEKATDAIKTKIAALRDKATAVLAAQTTIDAYVSKAVINADDADLAGIISFVNNAMQGLDYESGRDAAADAAEYVYYRYLVKLEACYVPRYYYDAEMSAMDVAVQNKVAEKVAQVSTQITEDSTVQEIYDLVFAAYADKNDPATVFAAEVAAELDHYPNGETANLYQNVLDHYVFILVRSFDAYLYDMPEPTVPFTQKGTALSNAKDELTKMCNERISELMANARINAGNGMPNYALNAQLDDAALDELAGQFFDGLKDLLYVKEADRDTFTPAIRDYFLWRYSALVKYEIGVGVDRLTHKNKSYINFGVSQVYGDDIYTISQGLKDVMFYYVTTYSNLTRDDFVVKDEENDEQQTVSKYLSDDGRIVAVTYGADTDGDGVYEPTKTFILNYNKFSVRVNYPQKNGEATDDSVRYTIPAYGYVVVSDGHGN